MAAEAAHAPVSILRLDGGAGSERRFTGTVRIGRGEECEVQVDADMVSRLHAAVVFEEGQWWIRDRDSTNGTYCEGEALDHRPVSGSAVVQLGQDGPRLRLEVSEDEHAPSSPPHAAASRTHAEESKEVAGHEADDDRSRAASTAEKEPFSPPTGASSSGPSGRSVTQFVKHYFEDDESEEDAAAGGHTHMIRRAYRRMQARQRRKYLGVLGGVLVLCLLLGAYALYQHLRNDRLRKQARTVFAGMKEQKLMIARLTRSIEASENRSLQDQLAALRTQQRKQEARYRGYVQELGLHRDLTPKEQAIYRVARLFGESEFRIPAGFVRKVKRTIRTFWTGPAREGFVRALRRAERKGYTSMIVKTLRAHGLPPELFYLALQESRFDPTAVGPRTRWGIAKGMWQFIPKTARRYGLELGPRVEQRVTDPQDERHDVETSTRAAADYLQTIYSTRAQASGLLVVASYNWGEHRVVEKMERLPGPQHIPESAVKDIPADPSERTYWQFLTTYENRMPEETKDYVLKIFAAAVIGQDPRLFGFSFDNPLKEHLEAPADPQAVSLQSP